MARVTVHTASGDRLTGILSETAAARLHAKLTADGDRTPISLDIDDGATSVVIYRHHIEYVELPTSVVQQ